MSQNLWHGLSYYDVIGTKSHLTYREMWRIIAHPQTIVFLLAAVSVLILLDAHNYQDVMSMYQTVVLWVICLFTLTGFYIVFVSFFMEVSRQLPKFTLYFPVVGILSMGVNTFLTVYVASLLSGADFVPKNVFDHLPTNLSLGFIFESIFMVFVLPKMQASFEVKPKKDPRELVIGGKKFDPSRILLISSQDHYLEVVTVDKNQLIRARLADVTPQISEEIGIVPHRSHWVAKAAVDRFEDKGKSKVLVLNNGSKIPVARGRVKDVRNWLNQ